MISEPWCLTLCQITKIGSASFVIWPAVNFAVSELLCWTLCQISKIGPTSFVMWVTVNFCDFWAQMLDSGSNYQDRADKSQHMASCVFPISDYIYKSFDVRHCQMRSFNYCSLHQYAGNILKFRYKVKGYRPDWFINSVGSVFIIRRFLNASIDQFYIGGFPHHHSVVDFSMEMNFV